MRVKCLVQEHNTVFPARARTARSRDKPTNHKATAPPKREKVLFFSLLFVHVFLFLRDDERLTPLIQAAFRGCKLTTGLLLDQGAKIDATDKNGV